MEETAYWDGPALIVEALRLRLRSLAEVRLNFTLVKQDQSVYDMQDDVKPLRD